MTHHVLDQLPLWIGGDLDTPAQVAVSRHVEGCPACRAAAENLQTSQTWLQEAMAWPFDDSDAARIRRSVMDQIHGESAQPFWRLAIRPALLSACAATLLTASLVWWLERGGSVQVVQAPASPVEIATRPSGSGPRPASIKPSTAPLPHARAAPAPRREVDPQPQDEPARIEFQTADPTIRIIWLAQAKPLPDTEPSTEQP